MNMMWVLPLLSLLLILALNWNRFRAMPSGQVVRLALIWGVIIAALVLVLKFLGY